MEDARTTVDLNADVGEGTESDASEVDKGLIELVTSVHVACGFHAGDPTLMRRTVRLAASAGVAIGAHPSYPDRAGFGRRAIDVAPEQVADDLLYQLGALDALARVEGAHVRSVKPHGALYNRSAVDEVCAQALAGAVASYGGGLRLVLAAGSRGLAAAAACGGIVVAEGFCDRGYRPDGLLAPRSEPGAVISDPDTAARRAVSLLRDHVLRAQDGSPVRLDVETLCVHGDTPRAREIARAVRTALETSGVVVRSPPPV